MSDLTLSDGTEITFDLSKLTVSEWRALLDRNQPPAQEDATLEKVAGLDPGTIAGMTYLDWRKLAKMFYVKCAEPLSDPN